MNATVAGLLEAMRAHLGAHELPAAVRVSVAAWNDPISVQLDAVLLGPVAAGLLAWAGSLSRVMGEVWRVSDGHSVHLSITGRLPGGVPVRVFDAVAFDPAVFGADLGSGQCRPLTLDQLRAWSGSASVGGGVAA